MSNNIKFNVLDVGTTSFNTQNLDHLNKILTYNNKSVRIIGSNEDR